jgi:catalase
VPPDIETPQEPQEVIKTPGEIRPDQALEAMDELNGVFPGVRPAHARGTICTGTFVALERAPGITRAAQFSGERIRALVRFSNAAADPGVPDYAPDVRGMAVRLFPPDTAAAAKDPAQRANPIDIVAVTMPCFFVNYPADFIEFTRCFKSGGPDKLPKIRWPRLLRFIISHRESSKALRAAYKPKPPRSYAHCRYNALHAYEWINHPGEQQYVRYSWLPEQGELNLSKEEAATRPPDYLQKDLLDRLGRTPARPFRMQLAVEFADEKDRVDWPAVPWDGELVTVGELEVTGLYEADGQEPLVFDPTRTTPGIDLSDDRILRFRRGVYELSAERRAQASNAGARV